MESKDRDRFSIMDEIECQIRALEETAKTCVEEAERLKKQRTVTGCSRPLEDVHGLEQALHNVDEVLEWRFVDELGRIALDQDMLMQNITAKELWTIRACLEHALTELKSGV